MTHKPLVVVLDDEPQIRTSLSNVLHDHGYETRCYATVGELEDDIARLEPTVCLLDLSLPDKDGKSLIVDLAAAKGAAVIVISGREQTAVKLECFELGADDYIVKPFDLEEVVGRIKVVLRRRGQDAEQRSLAQFGAWTADFSALQLRRDDGHLVKVSKAEADVLRLFLNAPNQLITRAQMQDKLQGSASESFDRAMDVRVSRLRSKLGEDPKNPATLKTIYGAGYIFLADVQWR
ncbi:MAG: response regulator transcription factor [Gammaproteobacteria bacterium]|nr:response regulator transcription factor [Gammaproteobacteria bacterium]